MRHNLKADLQVMGAFQDCRYLDCLPEVVSTALWRTDEREWGKKGDLTSFSMTSL